MRNIALYGGAFDPPHIGHLQLISSLSKVPGIDEVWLLPSGDRKDKKLLLPMQKRFHLIKQLFKDNGKVTVSEEEINMSRDIGGMVETYDLLAALSKKYKEGRFHFVVGGDILHTLHTWGHWEKLRDEHSFIIFSRKGYDLLKEKMPPQSQLIETDLPQISSSFIKKVIMDKEKAGEEKAGVLKPWLDQRVLDYLSNEKLL